jgi:hypothetical protein
MIGWLFGDDALSYHFEAVLKKMFFRIKRLSGVGEVCGNG